MREGEGEEEYVGHKEEEEENVFNYLALVRYMITRNFFPPLW